MSESFTPEHVSDYDRERLADILAGEGNWFSAQLFRLIAKADNTNLARLRLGFPDHVLAYTNWYEGPEPDSEGGRWSPTSQ